MTREELEFLTAKEVAERLRISDTEVYRLFAAGKLAGVRIGRAVRIRADSVRQFLERAGGGSSPPAA